MPTIGSIAAVAVHYRFERYFGGADKVPASVSSPSSHFQTIKRTGQFATYVRVTDEDGREGFGECFGLPVPDPAATIVNELVGPSLVGRDFERPDDLLAEWRNYFIKLGNTAGPALEALSGIDMAVWDLVARSSGASLSGKLGSDRQSVPTYASPIPFSDHPDRSIEAARELLGLGFGAVKMKIGRSVAVDLDHIRAVRAALPGSSGLMLDANCGYTLDEALALLDGLAGLDIAWLEEPVPPTRLDEIGTLSRHSPIPIAGGENDFTLDAHAALLERGQVRILQPNIGRAGGVSGLLAIGELAASSGASVAPHGVGTTVSIAALLHTCAATSAFSVVEANRLLNPLRDDFGLSFLPDASGELALPDGPGHGGTPDWSRMAQLTGQPEIVAAMLGTATARAGAAE